MIKSYLRTLMIIIQIGTLSIIQSDFTIYLIAVKLLYKEKHTEQKVM